MRSLLPSTPSMILRSLHQIRSTSRCHNLTQQLSTRHSNVCLQQQINVCLQQQLRSFHPSRRKLQETFPDHYATLELQPSANAKEIKKQFYALSKKYHPDVNHDPSASERFVKISEAYHVLGVAEKRTSYDRDFHRASGHHDRHSRSGSYSSRSGGPAGGRPASGLSKRRSQFRGPPPSFYQQGGYGNQQAKRARAQAEAEADHARYSQSRPADENHPGGLGAKPEYEGTSGFGAGDGYFDADPSMPYFDKDGHRRTHEGLGARREQYEQLSLIHI